jgi:hypothetical protein
MPDPKPERSDVNDYLECSDIIDHNHPLVEDAAEHITYGLKDSLTKARAIYDFVKDQIFNSFQINATSVTKKASEVIDKGHGISYAKAHLLAALMRASDIPAGFCYQLRYDEETEQVVVHGFNAVYIKELNKWIRIDASRHTDEDQWRFDPSRESPELSIDKSMGEHDDFTVYLVPSKRVMKSLNVSDSLDELRDNLPARI